MSHSTEPPPAAEAVVLADPAAAALISLILTLYTDPLAAPLTDAPAFFLHRDDLSIRYSNREVGARQLEAARALFGGTVTEEDSYSTRTVRQKLTTAWQGLPLEVYVEIPREDEVAELRKQIGGLQAEAYRDGQLAEQRHQLVDDVAPAPSAYIAAVTS